MSNVVEVEVLLEGVLSIRLNRPEARNAVNLEMAMAIDAALRQLDQDPALRVGVITGADSVFSAGMDLKAFARGEKPVLDGTGFAGIARAKRRKPLLAAVEGYALAGGFEIALACDLIVAGQGATFGIPEVKRGLIAAGGGLIRLSRRLPYHIAMEMALTGGSLSADRAYAMGLLNRLVPTGEARRTAVELAHQIARNAPLAVAASKQMIEQAQHTPEEEMFVLQDAVAAQIMASADAHEGAVAFSEKREPVWSGQ